MISNIFLKTKVLAFLGKANDSSQGPFLEISQFEMFMLPKLFLHFNFFMASSNYLYNQNDDFKSCIQIPLFKQYAIKYPYYKQQQDSMLYYDYILDIKEAQGFIIELDIQVSNNDGNSFPVVLKLHSIGYDLFYFIGIDSLSNIYDQYKNMDQIIYFYLNGNLISTLSFKYNMNSKQFTFYLTNMQTSDSEESRRLLQFRNAKVYLGGFVQQCDDCILKISDQDCLYCANESDYLEEAQNSSCKSSCSNPFQNLIDSKTRTCSFTPDQGMCDNGQYTGRDRFFSNDCTCPKGLYYDQIQQKCLNCLQYCNTCKKADSCETYISQSYNDSPIIVFGIQSPLYSNTYPLCGYISSNNWIVKGDSSMRSFPNVLLNFSQEDLKIILDFYFFYYSEQFQSNQNLIVNKIDSSITLKMQQPSSTGAYSFDQTKGIQFGIIQAIIDSDNKLNQFPFVIKITFAIFEQLECFGRIEQLLQLNNNNDMLFQFKLRSKYLDQKYYLEDETYLEFPQYKYMAPFQFKIALGGDNYIVGYNFIYFTSLQIYSGGFYYVNYDNSDPCFVYLNRQNMTCIYPKQGYALNKYGVVISTADCNQDIKQNEPLYFYNIYTMMCQNSGIVLPNCRNINIIDQKCTQCIESQMILSKNCQCPDGMFFNQISQSCKRCSPLCKTCSVNKDNCLECKNPDNIPPQCDCTQHNYFIDNNLGCQKCSQQCESCIQNSSYCLSCSDGRIHPPLCYCNPALYLNNYSDPITNSCQPKRCPNKCLVCDLNNECVLCRGDRILPPYCLCTEDYYDDPLIEYEFCQKCQNGFYFDDMQQKCISFDTQQMQKYYIEASFNTQFSNDQYQIMLSFVVSENSQKLTLYIKLLQNIQQTPAFLLFKKTQIFQNEEFKFVLNPIYSQIPYQFNIGPYFKETTMTILLGNIPENQYIVSIVSQLQIVFYILNSIQPTSMFILLNIQIPPNLYQFLQQYAKYVYRHVPETQSDYTQNSFSLFGLNVNKYVNSANQEKLKRLGFSDSLLVNCQMILSDYPQIICVCCSILNIITAFITGYLRPYNQIPYQFNIGPYFKETTMAILLGNIPENQCIPTTMFILLNIQIPPNLYQFLQQFAKYIYRHVLENQSDYTQNSFRLFILSVKKYVNSANQGKLKRLGFGDSLLEILIDINDLDNKLQQPTFLKNSFGFK
ncbi:hypothetical protein ABPG74_006571 [Tetrahymena malaccensis]